MSGAMLCVAKAAYKKTPGFLELAPTHLQWTPDGKSTPAVRVPSIELLALFCSKEGAAQVRLKVSLVGDEGGHNFTFISPQPVATTERENFKAHLTNILARNRDPTARPPIPVFPTPQTSNASTPRPAAPLPSTASSSRAGSVVPIGMPAAGDFELRRRVLKANPELANLHKELVASGQITDAEFWDGRQAMLLAQEADNSQKRGRPGQLVDPRPQSVQGENKIVITPQLVHDIFEETPVVAKAYSDNVPNKLTEGEFWKRYFQSKLFNAHRASIRSSAAQHVTKDDAIFDKYLEKIDDELEPRRQRDNGVHMMVDLNATQEDHGETGNEKDVTMRAGGNRGALPLIRKFNEHSERLLNSALGDVPPAKRRKTDDGEVYSQIDLDDLHDPESSAGIVLEMQDSQRYFEGRTEIGSSAEETAAATHTADPGLALSEAKHNIRGWGENLSQLKIERKSGDAALLSMTQNVAARLEVRTRKNDIPESLFSQMKTCQTAANEFLRQFWSTQFPPAAELQTLAVATPAQKAAKAAKMVTYLSKTHDKVGALIHAGHHEGVDHTRIEVAMRPVLNAVDQALAFHRNKLAAGPGRKK